MTRLRQIVGWLVLTGLVLFAAGRVPWRSALAVAAGADPVWLLVSIVANAGILVWVTMQWQLFLPRTVQVPRRTMISVVGLVASVSNTGPMILGYAAGVRLLMTRAGLTAAAAASVLALEQFADTLAKLVLVGLAVALAPAAAYRTEGVLVLAGTAVVATTLVALARRPQLVEGLAARFHGRVASVLSALLRAVHHLEPLGRPSHFGAAIVLGLAKKVMEAVGIYAVATALGVSLPLWALVAAPIATSLALSVSVIPAGLGVYEGAAFLVFRAAGVEADSAIALAFLAHATYLLPLMSLGWIIESARLAQKVRGRVLLIAGLAASGIGVHLWFALGGDALNSDGALVIMMARHFAQGEWAVYFWQQSWMANIEPLLLTPLAVAGLATPLAAGLVAIGLTSALAVLSVGLTRRIGGAPWMTLLIWAVPPALVVHHHVALYGARLAATLLALAAFTLSLRSQSQRAWVGVGVLTGLAYFSDHLMIAWVAAVIFIAARRGGLRALATGALPVVAIDACAALLSPAFHLIGPNPYNWLLNVPRLLGTTLPQLFGLLLGRGPSPDWEVAASIVPTSVWWPVFAIPGAITLTLLFVTLIRHRRKTFGEPAPDHGMAGQALALLTVVHLALFLAVGGGGEKWSVRYLVPLWPALSVFAAMAAAQWQPRRRPLAALAVLPAVFTLWADQSWPRARDAAPARAESEAVRRAVAATGVPAVWAEYWDAYRMALLTGETPRWVTYRVIERRPDWASEARAARPVAYLVRQGDTQMLTALDSASALGIRRIDDRTVGRFRLIVLERSVPGLEFRNPAPSQVKQVVAALSATMLFVGALVVIGLLPGILVRAGVIADRQIVR